MPKRRIYIEPTPLDDALRIWRERLEKEGIRVPLPAEVVPVDDAIGRVTAYPVAARLSSPFYHSAAMDGVAVRFADTLGASERNPVRLKAGEQAFYVNTGNPMPDGTDSVIMVEEIDEIADDEIEIISPATPWQHVRLVGEDIVATELIVPENQYLRPVDISALLAGGVTRVRVRRRPKVVLIPTGDELVQPGVEMKLGDIIEYNSRMLAGMALEWGADPERWGIVPDNIDLLKKYIRDAAEHADLVVVNAGSSAGSEDFTYHAIKELGEVVLHGINTKPGKPAILGLANGKPVIGVPGYPVSAWLVFRLFAKDLVHAWQGREAARPEVLTVKLSRQLASALGQEEFVRLKLGKVGENVIATPVSRGAGALMSLVRADGIVRIPAASEGLAAGSLVDAELLRPKDAIEKTIVCIGSHDSTLDLLGSFLKRRHPELGLSSAHVGSMGGLMALKKGEAHLAGAHLLDEETGDYNITFLKKYIPEVRPVLVNLVFREQGLLVPKGNPKGLKGFEDLAREDVVFVNRQAGAGTRMLTDMHLRRLGIDPAHVKGYGHEEYTHMGVASAVLSGAADTGLAVLSAANALGLDFIPVAQERYDLVIPREHYGSPLIKALLETIREDRELKDAVLAMGGYDVSQMGRVIWEG